MNGCIDWKVHLLNLSGRGHIHLGIQVVKLSQLKTTLENLLVSTLTCMSQANGEYLLLQGLNHISFKAAVI